jgi:hypothetical protein
MSDLESPAPEGIYCLSCRYELRGLTSNRCPECGRGFDPAVAATYTRYSSRSREVEDRIYRTVESFLSESKQGNRFSPLLASLCRQQSRLAAENVELRAMLEALEHLLVEKGIVSEEEIRDQVHRLNLLEPAPQTNSEQIAEWLNQMVANPNPDSPGGDSVALDNQVET